MKKSTKTLLGLLSAPLTMATVAWLGLQVKPKNFPPPEDGAIRLDEAGLPDGLPEPVLRHFRTALGKRAPQVDTVIVWGQGRMRIATVWLPMRYRNAMRAGQGYHREMDLTWWGRPLMQGVDHYAQGQARVEGQGLAAFVDEGPKIDQAANLDLWALGTFYTPSALLFDPRVRWEARDGTSARLYVPFDGGEDLLNVRFDPHTGLIRSMRGRRYRGQNEYKSPWFVEVDRWRTYQGVSMPSWARASWEDAGGAYIELEIDGVAFNAAVERVLACAVS